MTLYRLSSSAVIFAALVVISPAQTVTSARSGTLHSFDGTVMINGTPVESRPAYFPEVKETNTLSTKRGRAEVLLTPGVILRIGESSAIKMLDSRLVSTRVEFTEGSAVLEQIDPMVNAKGNSVTLVFKDYEITLRKNGLIELFSEPASMKVYKGEADVFSVAANSHVVVKDGRMLSFNDVLTTEKFDEKIGDDLLLWARDRSNSLSAANMASARSFGNGYNAYGSGYGGYGYGSGNGWYFNPAFGMFTYLPGYGTFYSPWGYGYYSPSSIYNVYYPGGGYVWTGGGKATGATGVVLSHVGTSGTVASSINRLNHGNPGGAAPIHSMPSPPSAAFNGAGMSSVAGNVSSAGSSGGGATSSAGSGMRSAAPMGGGGGGAATHGGGGHK